MPLVRNKISLMQFESICVVSTAQQKLPRLESSQVGLRQPFGRHLDVTQVKLQCPISTNNLLHLTQGKLGCVTHAGNTSSTLSQAAYYHPSIANFVDVIQVMLCWVAQGKTISLT